MSDKAERLGLLSFSFIHYFNPKTHLSPLKRSIKTKYMKKKPDIWRLTQSSVFEGDEYLELLPTVKCAQSSLLRVTCRSLQIKYSFMLQNSLCLKNHTKFGDLCLIYCVGNYLLVGLIWDWDNQEIRNSCASPRSAYIGIYVNTRTHLQGQIENSYQS